MYWKLGNDPALLQRSRELGWAMCQHLVKGRISQTIKLGYLVEGLSKQQIEGMVWFLLNVSNKIQEQKDELMKEFLSKKEQKH